MFDTGWLVMAEGRLYRALRPSWNVYPRTGAARDYWKLVGTMNDHEIMKKVLGLDQSSKITGVCRVRCCKDSAPWFDTDILDIRERGGAGLVRFARWLIDELATGFDLVIIERPIVLHASGAVQQEIAGLIKYFCQLQMVRLVILSPGTIKSWATENGGASKADMIAAAEARFGLAHLTEDEADAAHIADIGYHLANEIRPDTEQRQAILRRVGMNRRQREMLDEEIREAKKRGPNAKSIAKRESQVQAARGRARSLKGKAG